MSSAAAEGRMIISYDLEVLTPPCAPGSARLVAKAQLAVDVAPALPYLNAVLSGACFWPEARSLTWTEAGHSIALHPHEIAVGDVADRDEARRAVDRVVDLVNRTWERRAEIVPSLATGRRPTPMAVYRLLPGTNCKECGLPGCWHFALRLLVGAVDVGDCPALAGPEFAAQRAALGDLVVSS